MFDDGPFWEGLQLEPLPMAAAHSVHNGAAAAAAANENASRHSGYSVSRHHNPSGYSMHGRPSNSPALCANPMVAVLMNPSVHSGGGPSLHRHLSQGLAGVLGGSQHRGQAAAGAVAAAGSNGIGIPAATALLHGWQGQGVFNPNAPMGNGGGHGQEPAIHIVQLGVQPISEIATKVGPHGFP